MIEFIFCLNVGDDLPRWMLTIFFHLPQPIKWLLWKYSIDSGLCRPIEKPIWDRFHVAMLYIYRRLRRRPHPEDHTFWEYHGGANNETHR